MPNVVIQAGHVNTQYNIDPALHVSTGAPGEQEFTLKTANRLSEILRSKGFNVKQTDANANGDSLITGKDWDFFLAIHYEADIHGKGGGMIAAPDPSVDASNAESRRIVDSIRKSYFLPYSGDTGIQEQPTWVSNNMTYYYMWNALSAKTPCGLIECGVGQDAHDKVILADTDRVCNAIAKGLCAAFNVPWNQQPSVDYKSLYEEEKKKTGDLNTKLKNAMDATTIFQNKLKQIHDISA